MRKIATALVAVCFAVSASGCYHAVVVTGQPESTKQVEEQWVLGFIYGLVVPNEIDVADDCPNGVAKVETQLSFLNQVVSFLTAGIFTPMQVTVTCAAGNVGANVDMIEGTDTQVVLNEAATRSLEQEQPVYVQITAAE